MFVLLIYLADNAQRFQELLSIILLTRENVVVGGGKVNFLDIELWLLVVQSSGTNSQ